VDCHVPPDDNAVGYCLHPSKKKKAAKKNAACNDCEQIDSIPVIGTGCVDDLVEEGHCYYYLVKAISSKGKISSSSNETPVAIPASKQSVNRHQP
jgi:hypothetical protein